MSGHKPFGELTRRLPAARIADKTAALNTALRLHELRKVRTVSQQMLADKLAVGQPAVAKLERRGDMYVSNLRRYVEALGGTLEIAARFPDGAVAIAPEEPAGAEEEAVRRLKRGGPRVTLEAVERRVAARLKGHPRKAKDISE